jgi:helix-turn-helix protein
MSLAPSTYYYRPRVRSAEAAVAEDRLVARIREICAEFPRYGYRRATAQLKAEGERSTTSAWPGSCASRTCACTASAASS